MPPRRIPGVFCLETLWDDRDLTDDSSVRPALEVLERLGVIKFIHRDVGTTAEFEALLGQWLQKKYSAYAVGYLAFHGSPDALWVGQEDYTLDALAEFMGKRADGRILCFGACSTMKISDDRARAFLKATGVRAICGYTRSIEWVPSAALDMMLIDSLTLSDSRIDTGFRRLEKLASGLIEELGFRAVWAGGTAGVSGGS